MDTVLRLLQTCGQWAGFPVLLAAQQWKIKFGQMDGAYQMVSPIRSCGIGICQCVAQAGMDRVWMTLNQKNAFDGHNDELLFLLFNQ